jgi:hypothetical protein
VNILKFLFIICLIFSIALISGCTNIEKDPIAACRMTYSGFEVYVGNTIYHNCTLWGNGCASSSGCTFNNCDELKPGDYIHTNEYVKRCP